MMKKLLTITTLALLTSACAGPLCQSRGCKVVLSDSIASYFLLSLFLTFHITSPAGPFYRQPILDLLFQFRHMRNDADHTASQAQ